MENLPKDLKMMLALELSINDISKLCRASKKFNEIICSSTIFWRNKLKKDFPNIDITNVSNNNVKKFYQYLVQRPKVYGVEISAYFDNYNGYDFIDQLSDTLVNQYQLKKGDVIIFEEFPTRKYIWDGETFRIDYDDDYFLIPKHLNFPIFPPHFWDEILEYEHVFIPQAFIDETIFKNENSITGIFGEKYKIINDKVPLKEYLELLTGFNYAVFKNYQIEFIF
jgi:hypothetical protein